MPHIIELIMAPRPRYSPSAAVLAAFLVGFHARLEGSAFSFRPRHVAGGSVRCRRTHRGSEIRAVPATPAPAAATDAAPGIGDDRPHEQRAMGPRPARRMNQGFRYLHRHDADGYANTSAVEFLQQEGYTPEQIQRMNASFPPLLTLSVSRHLLPKMRFLRDTLGAGQDELARLVPAHYFGARLEAAMAPRHAYLMYRGLPHGRDLLRWTGDDEAANATLLSEFLTACRDAKRFAALCQSWQRRYGEARPGHPDADAPISPKQIEAFDAVFARGLMAAARNEQERGIPGLGSGSPWHADHIAVGSAALIRLLVRHGANPRERDRRGVSLLHWAAGTGNRDGLAELLPHVDADGGAAAAGPPAARRSGVWTRAARDGATLLHWAVAGGNARSFGTGGHVDVAQFLVTHVTDQDRQEYIDQRTKDGNSALMWAAWSGSLDCLQLLLQHGADTEGTNRNGCTLAHWATSGGDLEVCKYLYDNTNISFTTPNNGGHTPLTHAVAFGRADVVKWLKDEVIGESFADDKALRLAQDFVTWKSDDERRREVLNTFLSWESSAADDTTDGVSLDLDKYNF